MKYKKLPNELFDYYSITSHFMLLKLSEYELLDDKTNVLSVGCRLNQILPISHFFNVVNHLTTIPIDGMGKLEDIVGKTNIKINVGDFFQIEKNAFANHQAVLSQATIHCMADTRYRNNKTNYSKMETSRPYMFAKKLKEVCPDVKACIVSVAVAEKDNFAENASILSQKKFIQSFLKSGFHLDSEFYQDIYSGELSMEFPIEHIGDIPYVIGNFSFIRDDA